MEGISGLKLAEWRDHIQRDFRRRNRVGQPRSKRRLHIRYGSVGSDKGLENPPRSTYFFVLS
jgi:hypothetical protein